MTPSRVVRVLISVLLLTAIPSIAVAATTEFRVLFDVDNNSETGCTVNGMDGVEQVLVTQVTEGDPMRVTRTHRQICMGVVLGSPTDIVTTGWDAGWNPVNKLLTIETRIPFTAFGAAEMPSDIRAGFDGTRTPAIHTALINADGTPIMIPPPPVRRRAIGVGPVRHIIMDGNLADWGDIKPIVFGLASNGTDTLRLLRILAWPDPHDNHLYFAVTAYLGSDHPWADDDVYQRGVGESLSIGAPGVLDNDGIPGNAPLSAEKVSDPSRGTVTLNADGSFTYSPTHPQLLSSDEFEYKAKAAGKESNVARVIIQINQNEFPPCPGQEHPNAPCPDAYSTLEDTTLVEPAPGVLENDPHGDKLNASLFEAPDHGTVVINADGGFTYTPDDDFFGIDTFIYTATKKLGAPPGIGGNATVTITVTNVNDEPSFTPGPSPVTTTASSGPYSAVWATNISAGPDESGQSVNFVVSNDNTALFSVQPAISPNGTLTFTPAGFQGSATVSVRLEDNGGTANGGDDTSPTVFFTIIISCGTMTVTNPATNTATVGAAFSQNFTQTGAVGGATFTTSSTLPAGLTLATNGTLSGTPTEDGTFPIVVTVTDGTGCTASGPTYNLVVSCQTITVTNPANANGTASSPFSETFTQAGGNGVTTFSLASGTLPAGLTLAANGVLSGTPTQTGSFPITVMATDANGCTGTGPTYNLVIGCQTITVTNPANGNGTAASPFSETFTQTGGIGVTTFSLASGTLPAGLTLAANGVLSGTPTQTGSFPITVTATDSNGCTGTGATYTIIIGCQTITVTNPANTSGTVSAPFSETFTQTGAIGTATFTTASTLPAGLTLATNGVLSGTPTQTGSFPIVVTVTDSNGCTGTGATYNLVIGCQTITVTNPVNTGGTVSAGFSETFTQTAAVGGATFTLNSGVLPAGLTLATNGTLSGTPTEDGSFPITVLVTDGNGCTGVSATYNLVIACQTITVTNPANATGPAGTPFSETFTQTGAVGGATFTTASTLPTGLSLSTAGVLSGTPTQGGTFPIVVTVTDGNGCTGTSATYNLIITCQTITVTNPANTNGTAASPFSETFTQSGAIGGATFTTSSTLPAGLTLATNGVLSGTPTQTGSFPIVVTVTDGNGCTGTSATYNLIIGCQTITVTNPANGNGTASSPFSETFTQTGGIGTTTFSLASGTLPAGLSLAANGVLSGTPTQTGSFPITVTATDSNGCTGTGSTYTIIIGCQTITVTNPANTSGTVSAPFSETFTQTGAIGTATFTTASSLPAGLSLSTAGVLSGTPTQTGSFPIVVTVTDSNSCTGTSATYTLVIGCQTITVTNPANTAGTVSASFSETFTQSGAVGGATFTTASTLPAGLTLSTAGVLSGIPTQSGSFPIVVTVTDGNSCTGTSATYNLVIACQTITVTNPANATGPAGTPFSETFTQTGAVGGATFTTASTLPTGLSLSTAGVLSGTPTQGGTFPIVVTVTDGNGCTGTSATYNLIITCPTITVTNPANGNGTASSPFSETFTQTGGIGTTNFSLASGTLPAGLTLAANGVLSGTPTQTGSFPITVTATDSNGCTGTGTTYAIVIACQVITVNNPANANGTANSAFSETFTQTGGIGTTNFSLASGTLPTGLSLAANGTLSGTPTQTGSFPITVTATDSNGCTGTGATYTIVIGCQTITVNNPANTAGTVSAAFSETFTQTGAIGTTTFTLASGTLPTGLTLAANGVLSGTPTQAGSFPITVTATDANGCTGTSATYNLVIGCQTITVTNPANASGTVSTAFSETFTQTSAVGGATFTLGSGVLPAGMTLATNGVLSGTPTQSGAFPITVTVTDGNGCTGTGATYNLVIACQTITVTNPANATGPAGTPFSETFTQTGAIGTATFTTASTLPTGLTLSTAGVLSGTPTQGGTFPIVVTVTDSNGCTGTSATYSLIITCPVITVTNPANANGTANSAFSETFTQSGGQGTVTFTLASGTLPAGLTLATNGVLSGTPTQTGSFPITVLATDANGCTGTSSTYTIVIACQTITVTNPANANGTANSAFSETFTQTGGIGTTTFTLASGTLPAGLTLAANGVLSGTPTQTGSFPITVTATDANGCTGTSAMYNLVIACQTITVTNPANTSGTYGVAFSETFTQSGAIGTATFTTASTLPAGLTLSTAGVLSGTPTTPGTFPIVVTVTDSNGCTGTSATYNLVIACQTITVTNPANANGTVGSVFSETFTQSGAIGTATFTTASTLPAGLTLSTAGVLSGTPTQAGNFPITVTVTDSNGCTGTSATYTLVIVCQTITVTNPANTAGTVDAPFSETFTQSGAVGTATFTTASTLPSGLTLSTAGVLSGTPGQPGTFPIVVTVTDSNGCTGTSATYNLVIACQTITVTNPGVTNGTVDAAFNQTFTQTGVGTHTPATFTTSSTLPSGLTLSTAGVLSGTPGQPGNFPIVVTVTDVNGCTGTSATYNLVIACQTITVTNPGVTAATYNAAFSQTFTQTGVGTHGPAVFTTSSTLPTGLTLSTGGVLSGTPTQTGTFPIVVTVTDVNGCTGTGATYTLAVAPVATNDAFNNAVNNTQYVLTGGTTGTPSTPSVQVAGTIVTNDLPTGSVSVVPGTSATTAGGSVTVAADGTFLYTPPANPGVPAITSDTFTYTVTSNTGGTGPVTSAPGTVTMNLANRVWYVKNDSAAGGDGRSHQPFDTLAEAQTASTASDYIYVYFGNGTTSGQNSGFVMKNNQKLFGQGIALVVNAQTLVGAGSQPLIGNSGGIGVSATNLTGIEIRGLNIAGSTDAVAIILNVASTVTTLISNNTISGAGNEGIDVDASAGSMSIAVNDNTLTSTGNAIDIAETASGAITITAFDDNVISGNTGGAGIAVTGATFDTTPGAPFNLVTGGATAVGASGNGVGTSGVVLTNVAGDLSFTNLNIYNSAGTGLFATSTGVFNAGTGVGFQLVANSGTDTIQSAGGPAVNISTSTINLTPSVVTSTGTTTFGVNLDAVAGTFTAASGSSISGVASAAATAYRINNSSVSATYNGTISITQGAGVSLTTNTGTYAFTGQLTLSTGAANGFVATSSGTVSTSNTSSTLVTTTGTALNVSNTNIALAGLRFVSITAGTAASGPASGIILNNTGTTAAFGGLTIGGGASAGNGGTIQRCATGISLTSTRGVVLNDVNMSNFTDWAIRGTTVVNFNADNLQVTGTNGDNDATDDGSIRFTGLTGSATISNSSVSGGHEDNIVVLNSSGVLNRITISNTNIGANGTTFGDNGILFETSGTATLNATVTGCIFTSTRGDHVQFNAATGSPNGDFVLTSNNFSNSHPSTVSGAGGIRVVTGAAGSTPNLTYNITGNTINGARGTAIGTTEGAGTGILSGTISGNFIGTAATSNSGSSEGGGISVVVADFGSHTVNITTNTIRQYHQFGIFVQAGGGAVVSSGDLKAVVTGNSVSTPGPTAYGPGKNGFHLNSGTMVGDTFRVCLDFGGAGALENSIVGAGDNLGGNGTDFRLRHRQSTTVYLNGYGGANNNDAAVIAYIQGRNAGSPTGTVTNNTPNGGGWSTAFCPF